MAFAIRAPVNGWGDLCPRSTSPSASSSPASANTGSPTGLTTISNPPRSQIEEKINPGQIYGVADAQSAAPGQVVLLTAPSSLETPPTRFPHWPPHRFHVYGVLTEPKNQLGATPWINGLSHDVHWLHKAPGLSIAVVIQPWSHKTDNRLILATNGMDQAVCSRHITNEE